jgi:lysozyme
MVNTIIDIFHGNSIDLEAARDGGIVAVIHKATQGSSVRDSRYHQRREQAKELGLL